MPPPTKLISATQAAHRAGVSRQWIGQLIALRANGPFPGAYQVTDQPNSPFLIPLDEFEHWLKKRGQPEG